MKKKVLGGIIAVAIAAVAAVNVNFNYEAESSLSALSLANVEALADGESGGVNIPCKELSGWTCYFSCSTATWSGTCNMPNHYKV